jgi:hypothetical protein
MAGGVQVATDGISIGTSGVVVGAADDTACCCQCFVKPKKCADDTESTTYVVRCVGSTTAFVIGVDCWYVAPGFTTYDAIPDGYTELTPNKTFASCVDCDDCNDDIAACNCCPRIGDTATFSWSASIGDGDATQGSCYVLAHHTGGTMGLVWDGSSFKANNGGTPGVPVYIEAEITFNGGVSTVDGIRCAWGWSLNIDDWNSDAHEDVSRAGLGSGDGRGTCRGFTDHSVQSPCTDGTQTFLDITATINMTGCNGESGCEEGDGGCDGDCV